MDPLPYAIALTAGVLAVLNPCGFAMLPGYVGLLVSSDDGHPGGRLSTLGRALATTAVMTGGFTAVFALFGAAVVPLALSVERHLPWATLVIGAALVGLGIWLLAGREVGILLPRPAPGRPTRSLRWAAVYGATYAIASLSCTVAPFLALTTSATASGGVPGLLGVFAVYALGMALVIGALTVSVALARDSVVTYLRRALPYVTRAGGALLVLAGAYVTYYGWFELRVLAGAAAGDPVVDAVVRWQGELIRRLQGAGVLWVLLVLAVPVLVAAAGALWARRCRTAGRNHAEKGADR
ncbi:cytochrome c biogenesis CcdA family protein [Nocardiopsis sp. EMB25]|uniref:cytochrome c biogenesis CcdA family protein n=1 Tax=Nocardiopsis sp. EMB25 TaxID=2835867 RepID=UPI002283F674|nr:cytochrome c biogenesis CcdA family protein [Nocardiopsis sp. EMB25]MCY9785248.1 cytochrome c biogenesis CcdA family protein [Nocardiopsis sp. EMB25]